MQNISLNSVYNWLSYDVVRFKIEVGIEEKCMYKNVTLNTCKITAVAAARLRRHYHDLDLRALSINTLWLTVWRQHTHNGLPGEGQS